MKKQNDAAVGGPDVVAVRRIIADLVDSAARVNRAWTDAVAAEAHGDLDGAMTYLADVTTEMVVIPGQVIDIREAADKALQRLEELTESADHLSEDKGTSPDADRRAG